MHREMSQLSYPTMLTLALALCIVQDPAAPSFAGYPEQDALSYRIRLDVDPAARQLEGTVRYRFRAARELDRILLDAIPGPK